ncbi:MAG: XisI protein [Chloroflexi bacterium]|nr:XisI protein [Chloroflexota bacterium]
MDQVRDLTTIVQREVEDYALGDTSRAVTYPVSDTARQTYAVVVVPDQPRKYKAAVVVMARIVDNKVVIDEDITDRPLWQELVRAGIPREQIILSYAGESLPQE